MVIIVNSIPPEIAAKLTDERLADALSKVKEGIVLRDFEEPGNHGREECIDMELREELNRVHPVREVVSCDLYEGSGTNSEQYDESIENKRGDFAERKQRTTARKPRAR